MKQGFFMRWSMISEQLVGVEEAKHEKPCEVNIEAMYISLCTDGDLHVSSI